MAPFPFPVVLDLTRTIARFGRAPTGIDRVEHAYLERALNESATKDGEPKSKALNDSAVFVVAAHNRQYLIDAAGLPQAMGYQAGTGPAGGILAWLLGEPSAARWRVRRAAIAVASGFDALGKAIADRLGSGAVYLNVGHTNLVPGAMEDLQRSRIRSAVMIHDLIPLLHPVFTRDGQADVFRKRLAAAKAADLLIVNSRDTGDAVAAHSGDSARIAVAPLGVDAAPFVARIPVKPARFVCLGTIEPRKNHAMLLDLWRRLWDEGRHEDPVLDIVGHRGWRNSDVFRRLDTEPMIGRTVIEHGPVDQADLETILASATALVFPSLAEGYGLPLAEALARDLPVIASDLPALREVGGPVPEWIDAQDRAAWADAIRRYAVPGSAARRDQIARLANWTAPTWQAHFRTVDKEITTNLVQVLPHG